MYLKMSLKCRPSWFGLVVLNLELIYSYVQRYNQLSTDKCPLRLLGPDDTIVFSLCKTEYRVYPWFLESKSFSYCRYYCTGDTAAFRSSPPGQNGCHFADDVFRCIFMNVQFCILIKISLMFVLKGPIDNKPVLVWIMAWCRTGDKPLPEPMLTRFTDAYMRHLGDMS